MSEVKCTNLRFNLDKPVQRAAWEYLQTMDKTRFKSYSQVIALAIVDYFDRLEKLQDDPYLETREREERFVSQIVAAVERAMKDALPVLCRRNSYSEVIALSPVNSGLSTKTSE